MSDYEKIDDHKYLDGDDDVGDGVCNANGPLAEAYILGTSVPQTRRQYHCALFRRKLGPWRTMPKNMIARWNR